MNLFLQSHHQSCSTYRAVFHQRWAKMRTRKNCWIRWERTLTEIESQVTSSLMNKKMKSSKMNKKCKSNNMMRKNKTWMQITWMDNQERCDMTKEWIWETKRTMTKKKIEETTSHTLQRQNYNNHLSKNEKRRIMIMFDFENIHFINFINVSAFKFYF